MNRDFFQQDAINLAKDILGKYLIREIRWDTNSK